MSMLDRVMRKYAYVPLTPAAQEAVQQGAQPPMGPNMTGEAIPQGAPMPPQSGTPAPAAPQQGGMPPMPPMPPEQGGMPQIQIIPGPNGEPVDAETGFIVIDQAQGIEQDPLTGILFNKSLMEFATPDGQPLDPQQAVAMIEQARSGAAQTPPQSGTPAPAAPPQSGTPAPAAPPMPPQAPAPPPQPAGPPMMSQTAAADPVMSPAATGMDPNMMVQQPTASQTVVDPDTGMAIDAATGMPIGPAGVPVDPNTGTTLPGAASPVAGAELSALLETVPGLSEFISSAPRQLEAQDKTMARLQQDISNTRTDIQGLRREIQKANDNNNTMLGRMDNLLSIVQKLVYGTSQVSVD